MPGEKDLSSMHDVVNVSQSALSYQNLVATCEKKATVIEFEQKNNDGQLGLKYTASTNNENPNFIFVQNTLEDLSSYDPEAEDFFEKMDANRDLIDLRRKNKGYKFHISLDDSKHDSNLENGWNIINNILMKHQVYLYKIIKDGSREKMYKDPQQCGKEVTIYAFKEDRKSEQWQEIFQEITDELAKNNIRPGPIPLTDKTIQGCNYVSYRTDGVEDPDKDPYVNLKITPPEHQPARQNPNNLLDLPAPPTDIPSVVERNKKNLLDDCKEVLANLKEASRIDNELAANAAQVMLLKNLYKLHKKIYDIIESEKQNLPVAGMPGVYSIFYIELFKQLYSSDDLKKPTFSEVQFGENLCSKIKEIAQDPDEFIHSLSTESREKIEKKIIEKKADIFDFICSELPASVGMLDCIIPAMLQVEHDKDQPNELVLSESEVLYNNILKKASSKGLSFVPISDYFTDSDAMKALKYESSVIDDKKIIERRLSYFESQIGNLEEIIKKFSETAGALSKEQKALLIQYLELLKESASDPEFELYRPSKSNFSGLYEKLDTILCELKKLPTDDVPDKGISKNSQIAFAEIMTGAQLARGIVDDRYIHALAKTDLITPKWNNKRNAICKKWTDKLIRARQLQASMKNIEDNKNLLFVSLYKEAKLACELLAIPNAQVDLSIMPLMGIAVLINKLYRDSSSESYKSAVEKLNNLYKEPRDIEAINQVLNEFLEADEARKKELKNFINYGIGNYSLVISEMKRCENSNNMALKKDQYDELVNHLKYLKKLCSVEDVSVTNMINSYLEKLSQYQSKYNNKNNNLYASKEAQVAFAIIATEASLAQGSFNRTFLEKLENDTILKEFYESKEQTKIHNIRERIQKNEMKANKVKRTMDEKKQINNLSIFDVAKLEKFSRKAMYDSKHYYVPRSDTNEVDAPELIENYRRKKIPDANYVNELMYVLMENFVQYKTTEARLLFVKKMLESMDSCIVNRDYSTFAGFLSALQKINTEFPISEQVVLWKKKKGSIDCLPDLVLFDQYIKLKYSMIHDLGGTTDVTYIPSPQIVTLVMDRAKSAKSAIERAEAEIKNNQSVIESHEDKAKQEIAQKEIEKAKREITKAKVVIENSENILRMYRDATVSLDKLDETLLKEFNTVRSHHEYNEYLYNDVEELYVADLIRRLNPNALKHEYVVSADDIEKATSKHKATLEKAMEVQEEAKAKAQEEARKVQEEAKAKAQEEASKVQEEKSHEQSMAYEKKAEKSEALKKMPEVKDKSPSLSVAPLQIEPALGEVKWDEKKEPENKTQYQIIKSLSDSTDPADRRLSQLVAIHSDKLKAKDITTLEHYIQGTKNVDKDVNEITKALRKHSNELALQQISELLAEIKKPENSIIYLLLKNRVNEFEKTMHLVFTDYEDLQKAKKMIDQAENIVYSLTQGETTDNHRKLLLRFEYRQAILEKRKVENPGYDFTRPMESKDASLKKSYDLLEPTLVYKKIDGQFKGDITNQLDNLRAILEKYQSDPLFNKTIQDKYKSQALFIEEINSKYKRMLDEIDERHKNFPVDEKEVKELKSKIEGGISTLDQLQQPKASKKPDWLEKRKAKAELEIELAMIELKQAMIESRVAGNTAQIQPNVIKKNKYIKDETKKKYNELYEEYKARKIDNFDVKKLSELIGNYEVVREYKDEDGKVFKTTVETSIQSDERTQKVLGEKGYQILHEGPNPVESTEARKLYLHALQKALDERKKTGDHTKPITMEKLLGKDGIKLYEAAMKEEAASKAFRNAVFLRSLKTHVGPKWLQRLVLWVGGPSASGKTYATDAMIAKVAKNLMPTSKDKNEANYENHVVTIDGAIEREVSQIRQLTVQLSLELGNTGIDDLEDYSKSKLKEKVQSAVDASPELHMVIPETFTKFALKRDAALKKMYAKYADGLHIFSQVTCNDEAKETFQESVRRMGVSRAFLKNGTVYSGISINNFFIGCESKKYKAGMLMPVLSRAHGVKLSPKNFQFGKSQAKRNLKIHRSIIGLSALEDQQSQLTIQQAMRQSTAHSFEIVNDLVYIIFDTKTNEWRPCTEKDEGQIIMTTQRAFDAWKKSYESTCQGTGDPGEQYDRITEWLATKGDNPKYKDATVKYFKNGREVDLETMDQTERMSEESRIITFIDEYKRKWMVIDEYKKKGMVYASLSDILADFNEIQTMLKRSFLKTKEVRSLSSMLEEVEGRAKDFVKHNNIDFDATNYHLISWKDKDGNMQCCMVNKESLVGGEAYINFGYKIGETGEIGDKIAVKTLINIDEHSEDAIDDVNNEINANKLLYKNTSDLITFVDGKVGYLMDVIPGDDFAKKDNNELKFDVFVAAEYSYQERCQILRDIFNQLKSLHDAGYYHGDINPTNIKIYKDEMGDVHAKLFDFGQAKKLYSNDDVLTLNIASGMAEFVPPESGKRKQHGQASDLYGMAAIVGMMFTGNPNKFIEAKLAQAKLEEEKKQISTDSKTYEISKVPYNIDEMFKGPEFESIDEKLKEKLKAFVSQMANEDPNKRQSSTEAFEFFNGLALEHDLSKMIKDIGSNLFEDDISIGDDVSGELFSWKDKDGNIQYAMVRDTHIVSGEGVIRFGYKIDSEGIEGEEIVIKCVTRHLEDKQHRAKVTDEIKATKVLYPGPTTSDMVTFADGTIGYYMEKLPGDDFAKSWENKYRSVLICKGEEKDLDVSKMKKDQIILSESKIYWLEDGKLSSCTYSASNIKEYYVKYSLTREVEPADLPDLIPRLVRESNCRYGEGLNWSKFIESDLSYMERCQVIHDIVKQLKLLHAEGYCHGDINPTNIKIYKDDAGHVHAKLFDLGHCKKLDPATLDSEGFLKLEDMIGMVGFIAPESIGKGKKYGTASDLYSVGAIIGMMFTKNPNEFLREKISVSDRLAREKDKDEKARQVSVVPYVYDSMFAGLELEVDESVKDQLNNFARKMTDRDPAKRPSSTEALEFFGNLLAGKSLEKTERLEQKSSVGRDLREGIDLETNKTANLALFDHALPTENKPDRKDDVYYITRSMNSGATHSAEIEKLVRGLENLLASSKPDDKFVEKTAGLYESSLTFDRYGQFVSGYQAIFPAGTESYANQLIDSIVKHAIKFIHVDGGFSHEIKAFLQDEKDQVEVILNDEKIQTNRLDAAIKFYGFDVVRDKLIVAACQCYAGVLSGADPNATLMVSHITRIITNQLALLTQLQTSIKTLKGNKDPTFDELYKEADSYCKGFIEQFNIRVDLSTITPLMNMAAAITKLQKGSASYEAGIELLNKLKTQPRNVDLINEISKEFIEKVENADNQDLLQYTDKRIELIGGFRPSRLNVITIEDVERYLKDNTNVNDYFKTKLLENYRKENEEEKIALKDYENEKKKNTKLKPLKDTRGQRLLNLINAIGETEKEALDKDSAPPILTYFKNAYVHMGDKSGGANKPGPHGGLYKKVDDGSKYLFKQDTSYEYYKIIPRMDVNLQLNPLHHVEKDISEFVATRMASRIYTDAAPDIEVKIHPNQDSPYIGSKFVGTKENERYEDLFKDIYQQYYRLPRLEQLRAEIMNMEYDKKRYDEYLIDEDKGTKYVDPDYFKLIEQLKEMPKEKAIAVLDERIESLEEKVKNRPMFLGTKQTLDWETGKIFRDAIERKKDGELVYKGIEKCLVLSALFADNDVHSGNVGVVITTKNGVESRQCVRIDFGAALAKDYFNTQRALKLGSAQRSKFLIAAPTNHFAEYPRSIRYTESFAKAINEGVQELEMSMDKQLQLFNSDEFKLWPQEDRLKFAKYIGIEKQLRQTFITDDLLNNGIKDHVEKVLKHRMTLLKQYELDIKLSLCLNKNEEGKLVFDTKALEDLIRINKKDFESYFETEAYKLRSALFKASPSESLHKQFKNEVKAIYSQMLKNETLGMEQPTLVDSKSVSDVVVENPEPKVAEKEASEKSTAQQAAKEAARVEKEKAEAARAEATRAEATRAEAARAEVARAEAERAEAARAEEEKAKAARAEAARAEAAAKAEAEKKAEVDKAAAEARKAEVEKVAEKARKAEIEKAAEEARIVAAKEAAQKEAAHKAATERAAKEAEEKEAARKEAARKEAAKKDVPKATVGSTKTMEKKLTKQDHKDYKPKKTTNVSSSYVPGKTPKGFEDKTTIPVSKTKFSPGSLLSGSFIYTARFTKKLEADNSMSIECTRPPSLPYLDDKGMPTWKCLQYVKDQIRAIKEAFYPETPIIDVYDQRFLEAYVLICNANGITCNNESGKQLTSSSYNMSADHPLYKKLPIVDKKKGQVDILIQRTNEELTSIENDPLKGRNEASMQTLKQASEQLNTLKDNKSIPQSQRKEMIKTLARIYEFQGGDVSRSGISGTQHGRRFK